MIVVKLMGGLGNQMFQYALGRNLAHRNNAVLKLDLGFFQNYGTGVPRQYDLDIFDIHPVFASEAEVFRLRKRSTNELADRILNRVIGLKRTYIREPHFHFSPEILDLPDNIYLEGYWQTLRYFAEIEDLIRKDFTFKEEMSPLSRALLEEIEGSNSICVNVRRGDFVTNDFHGAKGVDYYKQAEEVIRERVSDESYYVFSDDIDWCRENLRFEAPTEFVSHEYAGAKFQDYLRLMSACRHFVIPNSSFAWWAVWFNRDPDKTVIAPKVWFNDPTWDTSDLTPASWIRL